MQLHNQPEHWLITANRAGTLFRASQFLSEELPIRLAHRVQELGDLPDGLNEMPSIRKVQDWYAQSFEVCRKTQSLDVLSPTRGSHPNTGGRKSPNSQDLPYSKKSRNVS